jgi:hypothetical protein
MRGAFRAATEVDKQELHTQGLEGPAFGEALHALRVQAIGTALTKLRGELKTD